MTRVRFDPTFIEDPRWERLGIEAYVLHQAACSYVVRALTDGRVSRARVAMLTPMVPPADAAGIAQRLVDDGMWRELDDGFHVCDCIDDLRTSAGRGDEQPSAAFVRRERDRVRDRKKRWRDKNADRNGEGNGVPNGSQYSAAQHSAVQAEPSSKPVLPADVVDDPVDVGSVPPAEETIAELRAWLRCDAVDRAKASGE